VSPLVIGLVAFLGVAALAGGVALLLFGKSSTRLEDRLDQLTGVSTPAAGRPNALKNGGLLAHPLDDRPSFLQTLFERFGNVDLLF
jgi:hypothetical protein